MEKKIIAVVGATGLQGRGVVNALKKEGSFRVRSITRNPDKYQGKADEVVQGDLMDIESLTNAFRDAYGVFVVTNFWEGADELAQGYIAVEAARKANVNHFVWSTLPNVEKISSGRFNVPQFTGKAKVDEIVKNAGFANYTFVQPPCYFQNFLGQMAPPQQQDGTIGWSLPIDPTKKVIHMADISDLGKVVAGVFLNPEKVGKGSYLSLSAELNSFNDILEAFKANGKEYSFNQVLPEVFSSFFEGAGAVAELLGYYEAYTYMGPNSEAQIQMAKEISIAPFISLNEWIKLNLL
ncbi:NmrA/HSCARG family protein [Chitinophaga rhizophila]|uniref:NmrA/HSCARG family protein n=1 Tax=Chitinophaga rhizophila TaxID=2866212 RepID=A0ABS7GAN9_9BACT|nr:NmrA/HSCARG family protein [Chitinophaga rhizophila]MBW8684727.1 NmrA/HSCARG family protein [Chitinophaga rhizophila]